MTSSDWDQIRSDICCSIPSTDVQILHASDPPFSHDFWKKTLSHLHGLQNLHLSAGYMPNLVCLLDERVETPNGYVTTGDRDGAAGHTYVPALSKLALYHIRFVSKDANLSEGVSEKSLLDSLATRKALRSRLTMLGCMTEGDGEASGYSDESY